MPISHNRIFCKKHNLFYLFIVFFYCCGFAQTKTVDWGYTDKLPQEKWGNNLLYLGCQEGNQQSPINIVSKHVKSSHNSITLHYLPAKGINFSLEQYSFQITYPPNNIALVNNKKYQLQFIRFKTPAENTIDSLQAIMEAQFFHEDSKGNKLIMSVLFVEGRSNPLLEILTKNLPKQSGKAYFLSNIDINQLLPKNLQSYQFDGSLTTPPCTQNIRWIVLKHTMSATRSQVDAMQNITKPNARHLQNLANRLITE